VKTENELADGLRRWAKGNGGVEAAVELLIAHRVWLVRGTTRPPGTGIEPFEGAKMFYAPIGHPSVRILEWAVARVITLHTSTVGTPQDRQVLALALHLAGEDNFVPKHFLVGLDEANVAIGTEAISHYARAAAKATTDPGVRRPDTDNISAPAPNAPVSE
jgi:hypothetical protein